MPTDFENFASAELQRRPTLLTSTLDGYDGDPNLGAAPAVFTGSPSGTNYLQESLDVLYRKNAAGAWVLVGGASSEVFAQESFSIPVDFEDVGAIDVPAETVFSSAADVAAVLGVASAFKYMQQVFEALPDDTGAHTVTVNLAGGVHRPHPIDLPKSGRACWSLENINISAGGGLAIDGVTTREEIIAPLTILSSTALVLGTSWPSLTFSGTPFVGLDLQGKAVETSDGVYGRIRSNTDSTLEMQSMVGTAPTAGVSTARIVRSATKLRNSYDDISPVISGFNQGYMLDLNHTNENQTSFAIFRDIQLDHFRIEACILGSNTGANDSAFTKFERCDMDADYQATFGITPDRGAFTLYGNDNSGIELIQCGLYASNTYGGLDNAIFSFASGKLVQPNIVLQQSVIAGFEDGIYITGNGRLLMYSTSIDRCGEVATPSVTLLNDAEIYSSMFGGGAFSGHKSSITNALGVAISFGDGTRTHKGANSCNLFLGNVAGNCAEFGSNVVFDSSTVAHATIGGLMDDGGNSAFGIVALGQRSNLTFPPVQDVFGASGAAQIDGVTYATYPDLDAASPLISTKLNIVTSI